MKQRNIGYEDKSKSDKLNAAIRLLTELEEGELSARENDWIAADEVEIALGFS